MLYYTSFGLLCLVVTSIINHEVLVHKSTRLNRKAGREYRAFLVSVMIYYLVDALWGVFSYFKMPQLLYADTVIFFALMALTVLMWVRYIIVYLDEQKALTTALLVVGNFFMLFMIVSIIVNAFTPVMFYIDADANYSTRPLRNIALGTQFLMFLATAVYTLIESREAEGKQKYRYRMTSWFSLAMTVMIVMQLLFPLLPMYSIGCMIATCLVHTFLYEAENREHREELEELLEIERRQRLEIDTTKEIAFTDPLTGIGNSHAYVETVEFADKRINDGVLKELAIIVFDLNNLKSINDTQGHEVGDAYIIRAAEMIKSNFKESKVFRIGGDEFVAFLEGKDFLDREALLAAFNRRVENNIRSGGVVVAAGIEEYDPERDKSCKTIFDRADRKMYDRKRELKDIEEGRERWTNMNLAEAN